MKKIFSILMIIAITHTVAFAQNSKLKERLGATETSTTKKSNKGFDMEEYVASWSGWEHITGFTPMQINPGFSDDTYSKKGEGVLFVKPGASNNFLQLYVKIQFPDGSWTIQKKAAEVSSPPSSWTDAPFNGLTQKIEDGHGGVMYIYTEPIVIPTAMISAHDNSTGLAYDNIDAWKKPVYRCYLGVRP